MVDLRADPGPPPSADLASTPSFTLGRLEVRPSSLEVIWGDRRQALEPRVMQLLTVLAERRGQVVSRDELLASVWGGRIVGEDAINRAVAKLRRLLEMADASVRVDTIPRVGFRLITGDDPPDTAPHRVRSRRWAALAFAATAALAAATLGVTLVRSPTYSAEPVRPLVSGPQIERHPALSPDGETIAYAMGPDVTRRDIFLRRVDGGEAMRLTDEPGDEFGISWSPDGRRLAYVSAEAGRPCRILVREVPAGAPVEAARCRSDERTSTTWASDGRRIFFTDRERPQAVGRIYVAALDSSAVSAFTSPPANGLGDAQPSVSPDGRWVAFVRRRNFFVSDLVIRGAADGSERVVASGPYDGASWTPDSQALVTVTNRPGAAAILICPIKGGTPRRLVSTFTHIGRISIRGTRMAAEVDTSRSSLARVDRAGAVQVLDQASGYTWSPDVAPDGAVATASNRDGENAVWLLETGKAARKLASVGDDYVYGMAWAPDGARLAYLTSSAAGARLHVIRRDGGRLMQASLPFADTTAPVWTAQGWALAVREPGGWRIWQVSSANAAKPISDYGWTSVRLYAGGLVGTRSDKAGVWSVAEPSRRLAEGPTIEHPDQWILDGDKVVWADVTNPAQGRLLEQVVGQVSPRQRAAGLSMMVDGTLALGPDGDVIFETLLSQDSDIGLFAFSRRTTGLSGR